MKLFGCGDAGMVIAATVFEAEGIAKQEMGKYYVKSEHYPLEITTSFDAIDPDTDEHVPITPKQFIDKANNEVGFYPYEDSITYFSDEEVN